MMGARRLGNPEIKEYGVTHDPDDGGTTGARHLGNKQKYKSMEVRHDPDHGGSKTQA